MLITSSTPSSRMLRFSIGWTFIGTPREARWPVAVTTQPRTGFPGGAEVECSLLDALRRIVRGTRLTVELLSGGGDLRLLRLAGGIADFLGALLALGRDALLATV